MSTGASRETRVISPNTNSSATRSPSTVTVTLGNASTILTSRSACLFMVGQSLLRKRYCLTLAAAQSYGPQHRLHASRALGELHRDRGDGDGFEPLADGAQVDGVFFRGDEHLGVALPAKLQQVFDVVFFVTIVVAEGGRGGRLAAGELQLQQKVLRTRDAAKRNRLRRQPLRRDAATRAPD